MNDVSIVTLETAATETGLKDFIAVGTTIDRGEDLAVKGAVSISPFIHSFISSIYTAIRIHAVCGTMIWLRRYHRWYS